jgi:hypothetical protein
MLSLPNYRTRFFFVSFAVLIAFFCAESTINWVTDFLVPELTSFWGITFFVILAVVYGYACFFLLSFVTRITVEIRKKDAYINRIHTIIIITQAILSAIFAYILISIFISSQYYTAGLIAAAVVSQSLTVMISILFARSFFSWFKSDRTSVIVLLYGLSFAIGAFYTAAYESLQVDAMLKKDPIITPDSEVVYPSDEYEPGTLLDVLSDTYQYTNAASFILVLAATALLLYNYSKKLGRVKYWIIILLPLVYFLTTLLDTLGIYNPETDSELFYWYVYQSLNSTAGGILFGIAYWWVAKSIRQDSPVRSYMIIAAYGFVLYFITTQVSLYATSYPPFGLAAFSLLGLSSYLVFLGLYSSAVSLSQDNKLRSSIKKIAKVNSNLLGSIGTAQMEQEIQKTVNSMKDVVKEQEKELKEQTGIEANLEEDEMKNYLEEVMQEVGKARKPPST